MATKGKFKKEEEVLCNDLYDCEEVGSILNEQLFNYLSKNKYKITNTLSNINSLFNIAMVAIALLLFTKTQRLDLHRDLMIKLLGLFGVLYVLNYLFEKFILKDSLVKINDKEPYTLTTSIESSPTYEYIIEKNVKGIIKKVGTLKVEELFYYNGKLRNDMFEKKLNKLKL